MPALLTKITGAPKSACTCAKKPSRATTAAGAEAITAYLQAMDAKGAGMALNVTDVSALDGFLAQVEADFGAPVIFKNERR